MIAITCMQVIRQAYQLREGTPEGIGPCAQAFQPLASGDHHYPLFRHFPVSAVKLQVASLLEDMNLACILINVT